MARTTRSGSKSKAPSKTAAAPSAREPAASPAAAASAGPGLSGSGGGRRATVERKTAETHITVTLNVDGQGDTLMRSGIGFLDHMLTALGKHSLMDIGVQAKGDLHVDFHHTVEDCGIVIGQALREALGSKAGVTRYGFASVPLDEAVTRATVDLSGRPYFEIHGTWPKGKVGEFDVELGEDFFRALAMEGRMNLHLELVSGRNLHHILETGFKAVARALRMAVAIDAREAGRVPSTKGMI
ncbi:MAG: imidazoleglycerol-phosphate dehydratase HisB [Planctomycetota bacterium]